MFQISIHAPARGATRSSTYCLGASTFQSTLPRGERQHNHNVPGTHADFNPRSREGSDPKSTVRSPVLLDFNPRSREGSDKECINLNHILNISIHAPARGATEVTAVPDDLIKFQSTLPRGERQGSSGAGSIESGFQSTLPRGERQQEQATTAAVQNFNPRSREGSDLFCYWHNICRYISIHAPARGATDIAAFPASELLFQSTLPRGERRVRR